MGRYSYSDKTEADSLKRVTTSFLNKYGYFAGWKSGTIEWTSGWTGDKSSIGIEVLVMDADKYVRFHYTQTDDDGEKKDFNYRARLVTTPCRFGGVRYWFICPLTKNGKYCGRRVGVLYKNGDYFGCRHCHDLTYLSKKENRRGGMYHLFHILTASEKIEKIQESMKRPYYAGKPTRKMRRVMRIEAGMVPYAKLLDKE